MIDRTYLYFALYAVVILAAIFVAKRMRKNTRIRK